MVAGRKDDYLKQPTAAIAFALSLLVSVPAVLVVLLFIFATVNPMALMFVTSFQIRNDSGHDLRVWFAGRGESGTWGLLPLLASERPALPAFRSGGIRLARGASTKITYDWDDTNFDAVLVEGENGEVLALSIDPDVAKETCCLRHQRDVYVVPPLHELRRATLDEREAMRRHRSIWALIAPCLVLPLVSMYLFRRPWRGPGR